MGMPVLRRGDGYGPRSGLRPFVRSLQRLLKIESDGLFGPNTEKTVRFFQFSRALPVSGVVDEVTWSLLAGENSTIPTSTINERLVEIARADIGQREKPGNMGFKDSLFEKLMRAVGWWTTAAWCDFAAEKWWKEGYKDFADIVALLDSIFTGSTLRSFSNFQKSGRFVIDKIPELGGLVYWKHSRTTGHVALITECRTGSVRFHHVAGNTNNDGSREGYMVAEKNNGDTRDKRLLGVVHPIKV